MTECIVTDCVRDADEDYCTKHQLAHDNIEENFEKWKTSYGSKYSWEEYLERLATDFEIGAGVWVQEVAEFLLQSN